MALESGFLFPMLRNWTKVKSDKPKNSWVGLAVSIWCFRFQSFVKKQVGYENKSNYIRLHQTSSIRFVLVLPKHQSAFPLASLACCCGTSVQPRCSHRLISQFVYIVLYGLPGIRINYHKLFERARNLHLLIRKTAMVRLRNVVRL